jgi:hypothetical protein
MYNLYLVLVTLYVEILEEWMEVPDDSTQVLMNHGSAKAESCDQCQTELSCMYGDSGPTLRMTV